MQYKSTLFIVLVSFTFFIFGMDLSQFYDKNNLSTQEMNIFDRYKSFVSSSEQRQLFDDEKDLAVAVKISQMFDDNACPIETKIRLTKLKIP